MRYEPESRSLKTKLPLLSVLTAGMAAELSGPASPAGGADTDCAIEITAPAGGSGGCDGGGGAAGSAVAGACTLDNVTRAPGTGSAVPMRTTIPSMDPFGDCCCVPGGV